KPILYAANVNEDDLAAGGGAWIGRLRAAVQSHHEEAEIVPFSAKFEAELAELSGDERAEYLASAGVREPGLDRLIHAGYHLLGLQTFFTVGENAVRTWTGTRRGRRSRACTPPRRPGRRGGSGPTDRRAAARRPSRAT